VDFNKPTSRATAADRRGVPAADADRWYVGRQVREDKAPFGQPLLLEIHSLDLSASYALNGSMDGCRDGAVLAGRIRGSTQTAAGIASARLGSAM